MNAWKCDICGGLYEETDMNSLENRTDPFTGDEINFYRRQVVVRDYGMMKRMVDCNLIMQSSPPPYRAHDICPDCMKRIEDFCKLIRLTKGERKNA